MNLFLTSVADGIRTIDFLKNNIDTNTKLVVLPFAHHFDYISQAQDVYLHYDRDIRNTQSIYWRTVRPFIDIGINPDNIVIINAYADPVNLIKQKLLAKNTIVYLPGGFPENIVKILKRLKLTEVIKQCEIVVGESAGSMFWSKRFFLHPDKDYKKYCCFRGIGLIKDFVIIPHFIPDDEMYVKCVMKSTKRFKLIHKEKVFFIEDGGWIWYNTKFNRIVKYEKCTIIYK